VHRCPGARTGGYRLCPCRLCRLCRLRWLSLGVIRSHGYASDSRLSIYDASGVMALRESAGSVTGGTGGTAAV
jgi:hypothetical protein